MANNGIHALLSYHALIAPLNLNPIFELERIVNDLRIKYRTYTVKLDVLNGMVVLPSLIGHDFGDQIGRYARLVDSNHNEFEVLVERNNGLIYLTTGWHAIKDFYSVSLGAWVTMVFLGMSKFGILLKDRFGRKITTPKFNPCMRFQLEKQDTPFHNFDVLPSPFVHDDSNFEFSYENRLTGDDYAGGVVDLADLDFCRATLDASTTSLNVLDDNGNVWGCTLMVGTDDTPHFTIGGGWRRMVMARRLRQGSRIMLGAPSAGNNTTICLRVIRI